MSGPDPYFFGYGSLVNRATHAYPMPRPARLTGWARTWKHTALRPVAFLTAVRDPSSTIDGLIAPVPGGDWMALDAREWAYERLLTTDVVHDLPGSVEIAVYAVPNTHQASPDIAHPILLSYLDVVVQGYLREFGRDGVGRFFSTTHGWNAPILDDRPAPLYPRAQQLSVEETALVDSYLMQMDAQIVRN